MRFGRAFARASTVRSSFGVHACGMVQSQNDNVKDIKVPAISSDTFDEITICCSKRGGFEESVMAHDLLLILIGGALGFAVACSVIELIIRANRRYPRSL